MYVLTSTYPTNYDPFVPYSSLHDLTIYRKCRLDPGVDFALDRTNNQATWTNSFTERRKWAGTHCSDNISKNLIDLGLFQGPLRHIDFM